MRSVGLFLISACIAVGLFYFVHSQSNNVQRVLLMPVEIHNKPHDKVVVTQPESRQVQVTVQGPSFLVADVAVSNHSVKMILPKDVSDGYSMTLKESMLDLPSAVEVLNFEPKNITVKIEDVQTKRVKVFVPRIGKIKDRYQIVSFKTVPEEVTLEGAASEIADVSYVHTEPLNMWNIEEDLTLNLPLADKWRNAQMKPAEVVVMVKIAPEQGTRVFEKVEIEVRSRRPRKVTVEPASVWVKVLGPKDVVQAMKDNDITAYVRLGDAPNKTSSKVRFDLPQGVSAIGWEPTTVNIIQTGDVP